MLGVLAVVLCRLLVTCAGVPVGVLDSGVCITVYFTTDTCYPALRYRCLVRESSKLCREPWYGTRLDLTR